jgi:hypothetical protein
MRRSALAAASESVAAAARTLGRAAGTSPPLSRLSAPPPPARAFASDVWVKPRSAPRSASPPPPEGSAPPRVTTAYSLTALEAELRRAFPPGGPGALPRSDDPAHRAPPSSPRLRFVGFDVEAKPNRAKGELNPVALIQITAPDDDDEVLLLHCVAAGVAAAAPERTAELRRVLTDPTIVPVGVGVAADLVHVAESFPRVVAADFAEPPPGEPSPGEEDPSSSSRPSARRPATTSAFLDAFVCSQVVHMFYNRGDPASLAKLAKTLLGLDLPKSRAVQLSDWSRRPLTPIQSKYAADDARVSARVFRAQHAAHAPPDVPLEPWAACFVGLRNEDDLDRRAAEVRDGSFAKCPAAMRDDFLAWATRRDALRRFAADARRFEAVCRAFIRADAGDPAYASPVQTLRTALQTSEMTGVGTDRRVREAYRTIASASSPSSSSDNVWEVAVAIRGPGARELFGGGGVSGVGVRGGGDEDDAFAWSGTGRDYKSAKRSAAAKALAAFRKAADGAWHCEAFVEAAGGGGGGGGRGCCAPTRGGEAKARREKVWAACRRRAEREGGRGGEGEGDDDASESV